MHTLKAVPGHRGLAQRGTHCWYESRKRPICSSTSRPPTLRLRRTLAPRLLACCPVRRHSRLKRAAIVRTSPRPGFPRTGARESEDPAEESFWMWF